MEFLKVRHIFFLTTTTFFVCAFRKRFCQVGIFFFFKKKKKLREKSNKMQILRIKAFGSVCAHERGKESEIHTIRWKKKMLHFAE